MTALDAVVTMEDVVEELAVTQFAERTDIYGTAGTFRITVPGAFTTNDATYTTIDYRSTTILVPKSGGRTCHAAIIARELGIPAIVGTGGATRELAEGREALPHSSSKGGGHEPNGTP